MVRPMLPALNGINSFYFILGNSISILSSEEIASLWKSFKSKVKQVQETVRFMDCLQFVQCFPLGFSAHHQQVDWSPELLVLPLLGFGPAGTASGHSLRKRCSFQVEVLLLRLTLQMTNQRLH